MNEQALSIESASTNIENLLEMLDPKIDRISGRRARENARTLVNSIRHELGDLNAAAERLNIAECPRLVA